VSSAEHEARARSFGPAAGIYERARPSYPTEAVQRLLPAGARDVADVGAGTGKLTSVLVGLGLNVTAVEPSEGMRGQFAQVLPDVPILAGSGERIPLPDGSVDAVLFGQAWHWVEPRRAATEVARVLRPGGRLGLVWNVRDESVGWVAELTRLVSPPSVRDDDDVIVGPPFGPGRRFDVKWSQPMTRDGLVDLIASRSNIIRISPDEREALLGRVRELAETQPSLAGRPEFSLPYVTQCWAFDRS